MNDLLEKIYQTGQFENSRGETIVIHSHTLMEQCQFLQDLIIDNGFENSIEIGFAYGLSTLAILESINKNEGKHLVIDKFQNDHWGGNGIDLIDQAGYSKVLQFEEDFCYEVLPRLLDKGEKFDFAYIDTTKQFDWLLMNFFFLDKLMLKGGIVVFDDVNFPGVRKLMRYIAQLPSYEVHSQHPPSKVGKPLPFWLKCFKLLPRADSFLKEELLITDYHLNINSGCVALIKVDEDQRNWDWHVRF